MGEYANYKGESVKIGTCEDMYYLRHSQIPEVTAQPGNVDPAKEVLSLRFRFPWPDEDRMKPGEFGRHDRAICVYEYAAPEDLAHGTVQFASTSTPGYLLSLPCPEKPGANPGLHIGYNNYAGPVLLSQQKQIADGRVVPVLRCGGCGHAWRVEDPEEIKAVAECFREEAARLIAPQYESNREWLNTVADRILSAAKLA